MLLKFSGDQGLSSLLHPPIRSRVKHCVSPTQRLCNFTAKRTKRMTHTNSHLEASDVMSGAPRGAVVAQIRAPNPSWQATGASGSLGGLSA